MKAYDRSYFNSVSKKYAVPLYQSMLQAGQIIKFCEFPLSHFSFLGTPKEYEEYIEENKLEW